MDAKLERYKSPNLVAAQADARGTKAVRQRLLIEGFKGADGRDFFLLESIRHT